MARNPRVEFNNAWYHVMNRGAAKKIIFHSDKHRLGFLDLLAEIYTKFAIEIHSYCLMDNHYHLLLRTPEGNLNQAMKHLGSLYTKRFNRSQKLDGPLFRGRYKAILIDADNYLLRVSRYIHRNPLEAGLNKELKDYQWSSYNVFIGLTSSPCWLYTGDIVGRVSQNNHALAYERFVNNSQLPSLEKFYRSKRMPDVLGSKIFIEKLRLKAGYSKNWYPAKRPKISAITANVAEYYNVKSSEIYETRRGILNLPRAAVMLRAQSKYCYSLQDIASHFGVATSTVSATVSRLKRRPRLKLVQASRKHSPDT